jgi:hypothetical protein
LAAVVVSLAAVYVRADGERPTGTADVAIAVSVLLEDNSLLALDRRGHAVSRRRLGPGPANPLGARYLAIGRRGELAVVLSGDVRDQLVYTTPDGRVRRRMNLPRDVRYRAIEVGENTGRIYLAGEVATHQRTDFGGEATAAVLTVMSQDGQVAATETLRRPKSGESPSGALDWRIYDIAVEPKERQAFVSYHGPNTDGADAIRIAGTTLTRCSSQSLVAGCIGRVHGSIEATGGGFFAALGTPPAIGRFTGGGKNERVWQSGFKRAHLMEFARQGNRLFAVESCAKTGGMTVVDLSRNSANVLHQEAAFTSPSGLPERAVCGERISIGKDRIIAVMKRGTITGISGLILLNTEGRVIRWLTLKPAPVDVIVLS